MTAEIVRRATVADAAAVHEVVEAAYAGYVPRTGRRPAPMDQEYHQVLSETDTWVADAHGRALGVPEARLCTNAVMTENVTYYLRRGYRETGRGEQDGFRRVFFGKQL